MPKYEVLMRFSTYLTVYADNDGEAIENAMDKAYEQFGFEAYEYGEFGITEREAASV